MNGRNDRPTTERKNMNTQTQNDYLLLFRGDAWHTRLSPEELQNAMNLFKAWFDQLSGQGRLKGGQPLAPEGKIVSGKRGSVVADGPFAESKEAIGGYFILSAKSLDEAVAIARGCPGLEYGTQVEVRPIAEECPLAERARQMAQEKQLAVA
jgi:hypothetical protein